MGSRTSTLLSQILLVVGGVGGYHLLTSRGGGAVPDAPQRAEAPTPPPAPEPLAGRGAPPGAARAEDLERRVAGLTARLESLEQRLIPASAEAGARALGQVPSGVGEAPQAWTDEQLASLRAMMDEVEARRATDRETASYRDLVRRVAPNLAPADENAAVSLVTKFMRSLRVLFAGGSAGSTEEERASTNAKAAAERARLLEELGSFLPKDVVDRLAPHLPDFGHPIGHTPPNREAPVLPGMER